jgi:hypothetical protein
LEQEQNGTAIFWEIGDIRVLAMAVSPHHPDRVFAGSEIGLHLSDERGMSWKLLDFVINGSQIWSIAFDPADRDTMLVGTKPPAVFRSGDAGKHWEKVPADFPERCPIPIGPPRVLALVFDPLDHRSIWAGVEVGGLFHNMMMAARDGTGCRRWARKMAALLSTASR